MSKSRRVTALTSIALLFAACGAPTPPGGLASPPAGPSEQPGPPAAVAMVCDPVPMAFDPEAVALTGAWAGDDGGIYYLRQIGPVVWWNGLSDRGGAQAKLGRNWNNVGRGEIDGLTIDADWADMPRGEIQGGGTLSLRIEDDGTGNVRIIRVAETGEFGNMTWSPCGPG